jgi:hypothetical protein
MRRAGTHRQITDAMTVIHALAIAAFIFSSAVQPPSVDFTTIRQGSNSYIKEARTVVVRTSAEWTALWKQHAGEGKPPSVDFSTAIVVGVFAGSRQTAGYTAEITRIEKQGDSLVVTYAEKGPGRDDMVAQMLTAPFHFVRTAAHAGPVKFQRTP